MNETTTSRRAIAAALDDDIAAQWRRAVQGDAAARGQLLRRIMPARSGRPAAPRGAK